MALTGAHFGQKEVSCRKRSVDLLSMTVTVTEGTRKNREGLSLFTRTVLPEGKPKAVLLYLHGLGDHCTPLEKAFRLFAEQGIAVNSYDHAHHGKSEPREQWRRCAFRFDRLVNDVEDYGKEIRERLASDAGGAAPPPLFLGGESLGALVSAWAALRDQTVWKGLIMVAPGVDKQLNAVQKFQSHVAGFLQYVIPRAQIVPVFKVEELSDDPEVVDHYVKDPLTYKGHHRVQAMHESWQAVVRLRPRIKEIKLPVFVTHAKGDKVTWPEGSKRWFDQLTGERKTYKSREGGSHILTSGSPMLETVNDISHWILETAEWHNSKA